MNPESWKQVRGILENAIALAGNERLAYLDEACSGQADLRSEVESLLRSHTDAGSRFLEVPAVDLKNALPDNGKKPDRVGRRIGVYQIIEEIGHGGMGEVYRAVRADGQYEKQVAIKLVRVGLDTAFVLERFRHERQILASLDHPNIARLYDGGTTDDGIPYLVMELIDGIPIDQYCRDHNLEIATRLQLFRQVCSAVQYAHQRLVIHRDIKPSNILVTAGEIPKLLDFGIAKILDPSAGAETTQIRTMTPEYASPEQIRGDAITTATDVYSLGVVLYTMLAGRSPYLENPRTPLEFARVVCEVEPPRPSTVRLPVKVSEAKSAETEDSKNVIDSARFRRALKGDVDNIVLKALRKEAAQRYSSVEQFSEDIRHHLEGLPVTAVKGSFRYRASKFVRRNRAGIAAGTVIALTLVAGVGATIRQARIARRQAEIASTERSRAERRFGDVRELANSLIFEIHDSIQGLPGATPSRKLLLDRAVQYLDKLSQDAAGDINLQRELAWGYQRLATVQGDTTQSNLGQVNAAEASGRKAMALFQAVAKANPKNVTDQLNLAMAYRFRAFVDVYEPTGRDEIEQALTVTEPLMNANGKNADLENELASEYMLLGSIQDAAGDRLLSIDSFRKANDQRQEMLRTNPTYPGLRRTAAKATVMLGHEIGRFGSRSEGLRLLNAGISDFEELVKTTGRDPGILRELSSAELRRGEIEAMQGDIAAARADFHSARRRIEPVAKLDPKNTTLQSDLWISDFLDGRTLAVAGRNAEALPILKKAFQGYLSLHLEADLGPGPGAMQVWIGEVQVATNKFVDAVKNYQAATPGMEDDAAHFDDARCDLAMVETKIGNVLLKMGKEKEAGDYFEKALQRAKLPYSLEHNDFPALYAAAEANTGKGDLAVAKARRATDKVARLKLWQEASASYEASQDIWKHISNPARISGNGYLATDAGEVAHRLATSKAELTR